MKIRFFQSFLPGASAALIAVCGYAAAQSLPPNTELVSANAQLARTVDSKDATQGQAVSAKLTSAVKAAGTVELPKGTVLVGQVEQVQRSSANGPASMSIVFDHAQLRDGRSIPIKATLLGAYPAAANQYYADTSNNGSLVGLEPHRISADQKVDQEPGALSHIAMHSSVEGNASGVFTSTDRNIDLKRGTQLQIAIAPEGASQG